MLLLDSSWIFSDLLVYDIFLLLHPVLGMLSGSKTGLPSVQAACEKDFVPIPLRARKSGGCSRGLHRQEPGPVRCPDQRQCETDSFL